MKAILLVFVSSILTVAAAWYVLPYTPHSLRMNLYELYCAATAIIDPCPTDEEIKDIFQSNRKELEELQDIIRKKPWSKISQNTGKDIVKAQKSKVFSYDPWEISDSLEVTTVKLKPEEFKTIQKMMNKCGVNSIIKEDDGVVKFEFWSKTIPNMRLRKFLTHRDKSLAVEDFESNFENFSMSNGSFLSPIQKVYFPKQYYRYKNMVDGWGIEYGIM